MILFRPDGNHWTLVTEPKRRSALLASFNKIDGRHATSRESTQLRECKLPCYGNTTLLQVRDETWTNKHLKIYYLEDGEDTYVRLNGTSPPIHALNAKLPIHLDDTNVLWYLSFFCFFVRGDEGPFLVIDDLNNPNLPDDLTTSEKLKTVFRQPRIFGRDDLGKWRISALIYYSNAVFHGDFLVSSSGTVDMADDTALFGDLPSKIQVPIA